MSNSIDPVIQMLEAIQAISNSGGDPSAQVAAANKDAADGAVTSAPMAPGTDPANPGTPNNFVQDGQAGRHPAIGQQGQYWPTAQERANGNALAAGQQVTMPNGSTWNGQTGQVTPGQPGQSGQPSTQQPVTPQSLLKQFLESDPDLMLGLVGNKLTQGGASPQFLQWYQRNGQRFIQEYKGYLAEQAAAGLIPTITFVDFITGRDMMQAFFADSSLQRGTGPAASNQRLGDMIQMGVR